MSYAFAFLLLAAAACVLLGLIAGTRAARTRGTWVLAVGLVLLGIESYCAAMSLRGATFGEVEAWQQRRLLALSLVPGTWLLFALVYARGNASQFLARWRITWLGMVALPLGIAIVFFGRLVA